MSLWESYNNKIHEVASRVKKPNKKRANWKKIQENDKIILILLKIGRIAIPCAVIALIIGLAMFVLHGVISIISGAFSALFFHRSTELRFGFRAVVWLTALAGSAIVLGLIYSKVVTWLKIPILMPDNDSLYHDICTTAFNAVDEIVCEKMQLYSPKTPGSLKPVGSWVEEINGVTLFKVEFNKVETYSADLRRFRQLLERGITKLKKRCELPTSLSQDLLYRGVTYPPILIIRLYQDTETITVVFAFANKQSCELYINSRVEATNIGTLYDDEL